MIPTGLPVQHGQLVERNPRSHGNVEAVLRPELLNFNGAVRCVEQVPGDAVYFVADHHDREMADADPGAGQ